MSILKYFKRKGVEAVLPDAKGPLSNKVLSISITEANQEVLKKFQMRIRQKRVGMPWNMVTVMRQGSAVRSWGNI